MIKVTETYPMRVNCKQCDGYGYIVEHDHGEDGLDEYYDCIKCNGNGILIVSPHGDTEELD